MQNGIKDYYFIDGFAGTGYCKNKGAQNVVSEISL